MSENTELTTNERVMAALSHALIIVQGAGIAVGAIVYVTQREKSRFAAVQGLQAAIFQGVIMALAIVGAVLMSCASFSIFIPISMGMPEDELPIWWVIGMIVTTVLIFVPLIIGWIMGLIAAIRTWQGHDYRYPVIANWMERRGIWNNEEVENV